jgi:predicted nucleic acid-binding protein
MSLGMMRTSLLSTSPNNSQVLILDASVTINLLGSGVAQDLLGHLGQKALMAERTFDEIKRHPIRNRDHMAELQSLRDRGLLDVRSLDKLGSDLFYELTSADIPGGLDDGEAAALALASGIGDAVSVLDDRKARNLLLRRWPQRQALYTIDLLSRDVITQSISRDVLAEAVFSALTTARMRVPSHNRQWVLELIGAARASQCPSLGSLRGAIDQ